MPSDEITSIMKGIVVPSTFPKERGGEKAYSARRGFRSVVRYVFLETGIFLRLTAVLLLLCEALSHRMRGSIIRSNMSGERGSPCRVPHLIPMGVVWPWGVTNSVVAPLYRFVTMLMKSSGKPRNARILTSWSWSAKEKAPLKSR